MTTPLTIPTTAFVRRLQGKDFLLDQPPYIKYSDCLLVLFYNQTEESLEVLDLFVKAAELSAGPVFAAVHITLEEEVRQAFVKIDPRDSAYALTSIPVIFTYQGGRPRGVYNGAYELQPMVDFATTLACRMDYSEPVNTRAGVTVVGDGKSVATARRSNTNITSSDRYTSDRSSYLELVKTMTSDEDTQVDTELIQE